MKQFLCPKCGATFFWIPCGTPTFEDKSLGIWFEPIINDNEILFHYPPIHNLCGSIVLPIFYKEMGMNNPGMNLIIRPTIQCIKCRAEEFYQIGPKFCERGWEIISKKNMIVRCLLESIHFNHLIFNGLDQKDGDNKTNLEELQKKILLKYRDPNKYLKDEHKRDLFLPPLPNFKSKWMIQ